MKIQLVKSPSSSQLDLIYDGLDSFNHKHLPAITKQAVLITVENLSDDNWDENLGGLHGEIIGSAYIVKYFWLHQKIRGQGFGSEIISKFSEEARKNSASGIFLETYSFQAPNFYQKLGFKETGRFTNFLQPGIDKIFMEKKF